MLRWILAPFLKEYWIGRTYFHYCSWTQAIEDRGFRFEEMEATASIKAYGAWSGTEQVAVCRFLFGREYDGHFKLLPDEAELGDIFTFASARGRGAATALIEHSTAVMHRAGFRTLYAKIWHSNKPSMRAFVKAGWRERSMFIRVRPRWMERPVHFEIRKACE